MVVFDKPAGLLVVPTPAQEKNTLAAIVNRQCPSSQNFGKLYPCHRLDRDTTGAIIFAKGARNQELIMNQFKKLTVKKKYIAFIHGKLNRPGGELKSYIRDREQKKYQKNSPAKLAVTRYNVIQVKRKFSVLEVLPVTGRTNQIRIQFSEIGHPLVGERKYAFARDYELRFRRPALHAARIEWQHPGTQHKIAAQAPWPQDMEEFLKKS